MTTALLVHYNMDPGLAVRFLGGEYTGEDRDVKGTCSAIAPTFKQKTLSQSSKFFCMDVQLSFSSLKLWRANSRTFVEEIKNPLNKTKLLPKRL